MVEGPSLLLRSYHLKDMERVRACVFVVVKNNCTLHFAGSGSSASTGMGLVTPFDLPLTPYTSDGT